jgi:hypothetical protein
MDNSRDSSVWRSLAVAFGDGLAFGVGMKLSQNPPGKAGPAGQPEAGRLTRLEHRIERIERAPAAIGSGAQIDQPVLEALTEALEARLQEGAALSGRRLAELDVKLALELKALRDQDQALASGAETRLTELQDRIDSHVRGLLQKVNEDRNALQNQVISLHREFAAAVADIVEEQVANQVEERVGMLVEQRLTDLVRAQLAPLEQELRAEIRQANAAKECEVEQLRQRVTESDRNTLDVMLAAGALFQQAARRLGPPSTPAAGEEPLMPASGSSVESDLRATEPEPPSPPAAKMTEASGPSRDRDLPGFAQARKAATAWSIPLITSFVATAGFVALLQYW